MPTCESAIGLSAKAAGKPRPFWPHRTFSWEYPVITDRSPTDTSSRLAPACSELNERRGALLQESLPCWAGLRTGLHLFSI